jgi:hypothetical protein
MALISSRLRSNGASFGFVFTWEDTQRLFIFTGNLARHLHEDPVYAVATVLGIVAPGVVVHGADQLYIALLGALVWAPVYGALGWGVDLWRQRRLHPKNTA